MLEIRQFLTVITFFTSPFQKWPSDIMSDSATGTWLENVRVGESTLPPFQALLLQSKVAAWDKFMPSFTFLIAALLFPYLTTRGRAETVSYTIPVNDLLRRCTFDLNGYVYDLCPLMGSSEIVDVLEESQDGRTGYVLALGGFRKGSDVVKNQSPAGCNGKTWVCSTSRLLPTLQPYFNWNLHEETKGVYEPVIQGNDLIVELRGNLDHGAVPCFFINILILRQYLQKILRSCKYCSTARRKISIL